MKIYNKNFFKSKKILLVSLTSSLIVLAGCGDTYNNYYYPNSQVTVKEIEDTKESVHVEKIIEETSTEEIVEEKTLQSEESSESKVIESSEAIESTEDNLSSEEKIFKFFNEKKEEIKEYLNSEDFNKAKEKGKELFVTFVDFIFYDGEIKGIKYDDLSEAAKKQLFEDFCAVDSIISEYIPNYKEDISNKYNALKDFVSPYYYSILSKIKDAIGNDNLESINNLKDDLFNDATDLFKNGKQKIKEKYENWRDK